MINLASVNLDIVKEGSKRSIRFPNGIQIEYGQLTISADETSVRYDFIRPFISRPVAIATWFWYYTYTGDVSFSPQDGTYAVVVLKAAENVAKSCNYLLIGEWK